MAYLLLFFALFLLPVFPASMATNRFLFRLKPRTLLVTQYSFLIAGVLVLSATDLGKGNAVLRFIASFSMLFYAFRLLGVEHLKDFALYLYSFISAFGWLWYSTGGNMFHFLLMELAPFTAFVIVVSSVYDRFEVVHRYSVNGLGLVKPYFSVFFILSLLAVAFTPLLSSSVLFEEMLTIFTFWNVMFVGLSWVLLNWSAVRIMEWLIFSEPSRHLQYPKMSAVPIILTGVLLAVSFLLFLIFASGGFA